MINMKPYKENDFQYELDLYRASNIGGVYTVRMDEQFTLLYGNDLYFQVHEFEPEELLGKSCTLFIHPQDLKYVHSVIDNAIKNRLKNVQWEMRIITGKNNLKYMLVSGSFNTRNGEDVFDGYITDISKSKEMERKLIESEEKIRIATENSDIVFWTYYFDSKEIIQTNSSQKVHGLSSSIQNVPESLIQCGHIREDSVEQFKQMYDNLINGERKARADIWTRSLNNEWWCERIEYTTVFDEDGIPVYANAVGRDVTSEKIAENRYDEELSYRNATVSQGFIGNMRADLSTGLVEEVVSPYDWFKEIYRDKTFDQCVSILSNCIIDRKKRREVISALQSESLQRSYSKGIMQKNFRVQRELTSGVIKWTSLTVKLLRKPNSQNIVAFLYSYDIDRETIFELAMRKIAYRNFDIIGCIHGVNDTYTVLSNEKDAHEYNQTSYEKDAINFLELHKEYALQPNQVKLKTIVKELKNSEVYSLEFTVKDHKGNVQSKQLRFSYIDKQTKMILFVQNDFTDIVNKEKSHQEDLQRALAAAEKANAEKTDFLSRMSHDMRTPMNGIIGLTNLSLEEPGIPEEIRKNLTYIDDSSKYLLSLINDTLDMNRIETNRLILNPEIVNARYLVDNIYNSMLPLMKEKNIDFQIKTIDSQYIPIIADKVRFQQIFINIISNAVKFTPNGGKIEWIIQCLKRENNIAYDKFIIKDNGIGMKPEFLPKIFEPFEQEHNEVTSTYVGTGLGMAIVKSLVEKMGGSIEVKSQLGMGTEVIIYLNFKRVPDSDQSNKNTKIEEFHLKGKNILLCEDHMLNMEIACKQLEKQGIIITKATNGQECVEKFQQSSLHFFDAILMDVRMPIMDGLEATTVIRSLDREDAKEVPIIAMTANAYEEDREKTRQVGMNAHLAKPIDPQLMYKTLNDAMSGQLERR